MISFTKPADDRYFVCEKMGLEVATLGGAREDLNDEWELEYV